MADGGYVQAGDVTIQTGERTTPSETNTISDADEANVTDKEDSQELIAARTARGLKKTFKDTDLGTVTLSYYDDEEGKVPVEGAEFTLYQIATIGTKITADQADGKELKVLFDSGYYTSVIPGFEVNGKTDAASSIEAAQKYYKGKSPNKDEGIYQGKTDKEGRLVFKDLPNGAYVGVETQQVRYHLPSLEWLVSVPETSHDAVTHECYWNFDVKVYPKANLCGDLSVKKELKGRSANQNDTFHMQLKLQDKDAKGRELLYRAKMPDGGEGTVKNGDFVAVKGGQQFVVYDIPAGSDYQVKEKEENKDDYKTDYEADHGKIKEKAEVSSTVINTRNSPSSSVQTGDVAWWAEVIAVLAVVVMLIIILLKSRKNDDKKE